MFDRPQLLVAKLKSGSITIASVLQFYDDYLISGSTKRSKFSSQFFGNKTTFPPELTIADPKKKIVVVKDHSLFKRMMPSLTVQSYEV